MSLLMCFYAGDAKAIGQAFNADDRTALSGLPIAHAHADFSLHLSPIDVDMLAEESCLLLGHDPQAFSDSLVESVGGDGEESSADVIAPELVAIVASLTDDQINDLGERWVRAIAEEHGGANVQLTPEVAKAIRDLVNVCKTATHENLHVVHTWSM